MIDQNLENINLKHLKIRLATSTLKLKIFFLFIIKNLKKSKYMYFLHFTLGYFCIFIKYYKKIK